MELSNALAIRANQRTDVWCWAASLEMIFKANGYNVRQERFVQEVYGQVVKLPAMHGYQITQQLSKDWTDDEGQTFTVQIDQLYDHDSRTPPIPPSLIVQSLREGHPLLLCNTHHAMVLGVVDYFPSQPQPMIHAAGLIDPWPQYDPSQGGTHGLTDLRDMIPMEFGGQMRYLAIPRFS